MIERLAKNVLDMPGVDGLCLFGAEGKLLFDRLPDYCVAETIGESLERIVSLYEMVDDNFVPGDDYWMHFAEKDLMVRRKGEGFLLIFIESRVNLTTLRMTTNLLLKHFKPEDFKPVAPLESAPAPEVPQEASPVETPPPQPAASAPEPSPAEGPTEPEAGQSQRTKRKKVRTFRGKSY